MDINIKTLKTCSACHGDIVEVLLMSSKNEIESGGFHCNECGLKYVETHQNALKKFNAHSFEEFLLSLFTATEIIENSLISNGYRRVGFKREITLESKERREGNRRKSEHSWYLGRKKEKVLFVKNHFFYEEFKNYSESSLEPPDSILNLWYKGDEIGIVFLYEIQANNLLILEGPLNLPVEYLEMEEKKVSKI